MEDEVKPPDESLRIAVQRISKLPTIPAVAQEILSLINDEMAPMDKLEDVIGKDPIISAKILSYANSAFFGMGQPTTTVSGAISRIGLNNVKNIALGISLMTVFDSPRGGKILDYERIFKHSIAVGTIADFIMHRVFPNSGEKIFIDGILHDMGLLVLNRYFPELYSQVIMENKAGTPLIEAEMQIMGFTHAHIGMWLADKWNLPDGIAATILNHHTPALATTGANAGGRTPTEAESRTIREKTAVIHLSDYLISESFFAVTKKSPGYHLDPVALDIMRLSQKDMEELTARVTAYMISKGFQMSGQ
jgi:HD-like signal output (HDOD) protein